MEQLGLLRDHSTESEVLANAGVMRTTLLPAGWDHVVVDIDWYDPEFLEPARALHGTQT